MSGGLTIGVFFGIPVKLHFTMALLLFTYEWIPGAGVGGFAAWLVFMVMVFGSILLHELGHSLTARRYGIRTQDIVLTPIGGIARLTSNPKTPRQEIAIALAGPVVSFVLAGAAFVIMPLSFRLGLPESLVLALYSTFWVNLMLGAFNLIPALPMDGGRVFRGILELRRDHLTATRLAAKVSRTLAVAGGFFAFFGAKAGWFEFHWSYLIIAFFVYITAGSELRMAEFRAMREQAEKNGGYGPFPGAAFSKVWTWPPRGGQQPYSNAQPFAGQPLREDEEKPLVIEGGRAEILSKNKKEEP